MREIKFRAWIVRAKEMEYNIFLARNSLEQHQQQGDEVIGMQYTGIRDREDKEIYEGDILDARGQYSENLPQPVIWWSTGWYVGYDDGKHNNVTALGALEKPWVIGNIYENPELLKEAQ